jgi:hypothetical protein
MAQAFVQKVFHERKTQSTIQVLSEASSLDEAQIKTVITRTAEKFMNDKKAKYDDKSYDLSTALSTALFDQCSSVEGHKIVVNVVICDQWGQGIKAKSQSLLNVNSDRHFSWNIKTDNEMAVISIYFLKITEDSSDEEEELEVSSE